MNISNLTITTGPTKNSRRILKGGHQPAKLPIPENVRRQRRIDYWRRVIWDVDNRFITVLQPQVREMFRKIAFGMEREKRADLFKNFQLGLLQFWMKTGSVPKMEEYITAVWGGQVFLFDVGLPALPKKITADYPALDSLKSFLIYQPCQDSRFTDGDRVLGAKRFTAYLGPIAPERPWNFAWVSEMEMVREQAAAELGADAVQEFCINDAITCKQ